jgi:hypothetical protein
MSSSLKKYLLLLLLLCISGSSYWFFFLTHWGIIINKEHLWNYSLQPKNVATYNAINWEAPKKEKENLEDKNNLNLLFQTEFFLKDHTKIIEGILEYDNRYSVIILINGKKYADINKNLITPSIENNKIAVYESWRLRKINLNNKFLQTHLVKGKNTWTLVVYNVEDFKSLECAKKQLSFLCKGRSNDFKSTLNVKKQTDFFTESELPIFKINTHKLPIPDEPKIKASLNIINNFNKKNTLSDSSAFHSIKIERRGHTSQTFAKKSYSFNLYEENDRKIPKSLLSLPASKKWVLYGPYADKSLIRNALTYSLYTQMGNYAPRTQFIELVINDNYRGIYLLTEKIQIGPNHLAIQKLTTDSTLSKGGYLLEIDRNNWKSDFPPDNDTSAIPVSYDVYDPKKITPNQEKIIKEQYNSFEQHLYEKDSMYNYLDLQSFIDYLIITEVSKNIDGYRLSTFLYNEDINNSIPKFHIGPIWDYNFSFGLTDYHEGFNPEGYVYNLDNYVPFWWNILLQDSIFSVQLSNRYFELRKTVLSNHNINSAIDSLSASCKSSSALNFKKWDVLNSTEFWPNYYLGKSYNDEINYLKTWINKRLQFLDADILAKDKKGIKYYEIAIRNDKNWMKGIKLKAKEKNTSVNEMIKIDVKYMYEKEQ